MANSGSPRRVMMIPDRLQAPLRSHADVVSPCVDRPRQGSVTHPQLPSPEYKAQMCLITHIDNFCQLQAELVQEHEALLTAVDGTLEAQQVSKFPKVFLSLSSGFSDSVLPCKATAMRIR